jgi:LPPG:FO 2-phospho-L-lactate transferase
MRVVAICGGVGGAKLAHGLQQSVPPGQLHVIVNTGDDFEHRGLPICPDLDTVLYTLGGIADAAQGWGRANETWQVQSQWRELGLDTWFQLGDRDIALHLYRRELAAQGRKLSEITRILAQKFQVPSELLPMCEEPAPTTVLTDRGEMPFQEYFVRYRCAPVVRAFRYGAQGVFEPPARVRSLLESADIDGIILCPSNPYLSIAPILAVRGMRELLACARVPVIAVSPIIGGEAVKGPAAKIMRELEHEVSPLAIAREYCDFLDVMLIDGIDSGLLASLDSRDPAFETTSILMRTDRDRRSLAERCLELLRRLKS